MIFSKLKMRLNIAIFSLLTIVSILMVFAANYVQKQYALSVAEKKSLILLQHNLAIHSYINNNLKPNLFTLTEKSRESDYFDPTWMSSTYAVREIDKIYGKGSGRRYYYKEAAINARSPQNEADAFERDFIERLNKDQQLQKISGVRDFDGQPYFYTLIRGESMEKGCLRCHSTHDKAPGNMVKTYGPARSFNRSVDEVVSAISIHIPLVDAYTEANTFSLKLSALLLTLLLCVFILQNLLINHLVLAPLQNFRSKAESIANDPDNLGVVIPEKYTQEMNEIAVSFNKMSSKLKEVVDGLDDTIKLRTEALHESEANYLLLFENMANGFALHEMIYDTQGNPSDYRFVEVNPEFEKQTGLKAAEIVGRTVLDVIPNVEKTWIETYGRVVATGEPVSFESFSSELGRYYQVWAFCPKPGYFATVVCDITENKRSEKERRVFDQQLQHTQKLESLGILSGGIAHDFNNILAIIMGHCFLTKMNYATAENNVNEIEKAVERAAGLCRQMLAYAGKALLTKTRVNLCALVEEMVTMLRSTLPQNSVIKTDFSPEIAIVNGDASQLTQVIMNLIINASEAMDKEQGKIGVSLSRTTLSVGQSDLDYNGKPIPPGLYVCLEVTDNGCGMDEETKRRIFEPFYSTKFTGRGLGMSAVLGIITSHNGALQLFSQTGQGATFKIYLPAEPADAESQLEPVRSTPWQGNGTILLVEDEEQVRAVANVMLKTLGFTVVEAADGKEALALYQQYSADIVLVVTDIGMPVMDGYTLFRELKLLAPELPIVICSGFGEADIESQIAPEVIAGLISKPYNFDQLRDILQSVLGQSADD